MNLLRFGNFELDLSKRRLSASGNVLHLGGKAFDILATLATRAGEVVSKQELLSAVWPDRIVEDGALRVHMVGLRKLLDGRNGGTCIENVPGRGYVFVLPTISVDETAPDIPSFHPQTEADAQSHFPRLVTRLIGRDDFIIETARALETHRLVTIAGTGGIGKTSVALAVAEILERTERVLFLDLASLSDGHFVLTTLATLLGVTVYSTDVEERVLQALSTRRLLLILDNCEHLIEAVAAVVEQILATAPDVSILTTSREPLRASCERVKRLASLPVPPPNAPSDAIASYAAVQLLLDRVALSSELEDLDHPDNLEAAASIVRQLDGIPLAIELAASHAANLDLGHLAASLDNPLALLRRGRRTAPPRQQTLRATLDWSYAGLTPAERVIFECVAVFAGSFTALAARSVSAREMTDEAFYEAFDGLFLKSLLSVAGGDGTYRLPETTRHYALEKLHNGGHAVPRRIAHAAYCEQELAAAEHDWKLLPTPEWMRRYSALVNDVRAAIRWSSGEPGQSGYAISLAARSDVLWMQLGLMSEQIKLVEWALSALPGTAYDGSEIEIELRIAKGGTLYHIRGFAYDDAALIEFQRAAEIAQRVGDVPKYIQAIGGITSIWTSNGLYSRAIDRALLLREEFPDLPFHTFSRMLEHSYLFRGDFEEARAQAEGSLQNAKGLARLTHNAGVGYDQRMVAMAVLAFIDFLQGKFTDAFTRLDDALAEAARLDFALASCLLLTTAAIPMAYLTNDRQRAEKYVEKASCLTRKHTLNRLAQWVEVYRKIILDEVQETELSTLLVEAVGIRLDYCVVLSGSRASLASLDKALSGEGGWGRPELLRLKAECLSASDPVQAAALAAESVDLSRKMGATFWEQRCLQTAGLIDTQTYSSTSEPAA